MTDILSGQVTSFLALSLQAGLTGVWKVPAPRGQPGCASGLRSEQWNLELTASIYTPGKADGQTAGAAAFLSVSPPREQHVILVTVGFLGGRWS